MPERVAVVGAGIVGIAHAWREAVRGARVTLFERSRRAEGASVRNFGMVWPIGQSAENLEAALLSRSLWDEFVQQTGVWNSPSGSLHLVTESDELRVLDEFSDLAPSLGYDCELLSRSRLEKLCAAARLDRIAGGLHSHTEMGVDPREVIAKAPGWLSDRHGVELEFETTVIEAAPPALRSTDGRTWEFDRVTVASGADFATLFPEVFSANGFGVCQLQMLRTVAQPNGWRVGPMVASALSLRHYPSFAVCEGLAALRERVAADTPELNQYGIHVMAAQNGGGEVVLGDSHEYGADVDPFGSERINGLILRELRKLIDLPDWSLSAQWLGRYAVRQGTRTPQYVHQPREGVTIVIATGGCGMTMSFGLAERMIDARSRTSSTPQDSATVVDAVSG